MKFELMLLIFISLSVTPFVGVWIEMDIVDKYSGKSSVTPFVGVWIEIMYVFWRTQMAECHTLRGSVD